MTATSPEGTVPRQCTKTESHPPHTWFGASENSATRTIAVIALSCNGVKEDQ